MYFNWRSEHNPLYKDIEFSRTKLSEFERKLTEGTEDYVKHSDCKIIEDEVEKECISGYTSEDPLEESHIIHDNTINPIEIKERLMFNILIALCAIKMNMNGLMILL